MLDKYEQADKTKRVKSATLLKSGLLKGNANFYRLDPPLEGHEFVIVSAVSAFGADETYIFPADSSGQVLDYSELRGSFRGSQDHKLALRGAGYEEFNVDFSPIN